MPPTLNDLEDSLESMRDDLESMASTLSKGIRDNLSDALTDLNNMAEALREGKDITKDLATKTLQYQKQSNKLALDQTSLEAQLLKAVRDRNYAAQQKIEKQLIENQNAQHQIERQLDTVKLLGQQTQEEKKISDEKKNQNNLSNALNEKFKQIGETFKKWFTLGSIIDMLFKGSENIANFRKELGISYENAYLLNTQLGFVGNNVFDAYINGEKLKKAFTDLSKEMGFIVDYGNESLVTMTNLTGRLGMSNKEAAQLTTLSRMQSTDTEAVLDNVGKAVTAMNKQGKTAFLLKDIMKEVANVSKATAVSLGSNPVKIAEAVTAAKQLGTTLQQMESTADALLNFETSIGDELRAELLTGKEMNLERARAAALANDMKSLSEEVGKNEEIIGAFASGNRLAQEATAKALGMSREQLAEMVYKQEAALIGAEGVRAKYGEQAYEQLKAQNAQEKFNNSVEKLKTALSSVVQIFSPLLDLLATASEFVANIVSQWYIFYPLLAGAALLYLPAIVSSFAGIGKSITGIGTNFKSLFSKEGRASLMGGGDKVKETAEKASEKGGKVGAGGAKAGDGIKNTLKGISAGIQSFGKVSLADIGKLALSALALVAFTPAIPALLMLQFVNGKLIENALIGLGKGLAALGKAISGGQVILGIAVLTGAMIGLGYALNLAAPGIEAFGTVIKSVFEGIGTIITAAAAGISTMFNSLQNVDVSKLLAIGPALIGIGVGLASLGAGGVIGAIGAFLGGDPIEKLQSLAAAGDGLTKTATALQTIAGALAEVSAALAAIDTSKLGALNEFSNTQASKSAISGITDFITAPIKAIGESIGGNKEEINTGIDLTPMIAAINEVKASVDRLYNKDTSINMDGKKVGTTLVQSSYKLA